MTLVCIFRILDKVFYSLHEFICRVVGRDKSIQALIGWFWIGLVGIYQQKTLALRVITLDGLAEFAVVTGVH